MNAIIKAAAMLISKPEMVAAYGGSDYHIEVHAFLREFSDNPLS